MLRDSQTSKGYHKPSNCRSVPDKGREAEAQALLTSKFAVLNKRSAFAKSVIGRCSLPYSFWQLGLA